MEATYVKDVSHEFKGQTLLYKLSHPYIVDPGLFPDPDALPFAVRYVVVSAVNTYSGPETYVFPADEHGNVLDWGELPGSFQGDLNHDVALTGFLLACQEIHQESIYNKGRKE